MKINEILPNQGIIGQTLGAQSQDIGSFYVHDRPLYKKPQANWPVQAKQTTVTLPAAEPSSKEPTAKPADASKSDKEKNRDTPAVIKPNLDTKPQKTVTMKSGEKISKGSDGFWRTQDNKIIDMPELIGALEKLSAAPAGQAAMQTTPKTPAEIPSRRKRARNVT